jgi:hypothetical protein
MEEKPKYGWYVKNIIVSFTVIGLFGLIFLVYGLMIQGLLGIILIIISIATVSIFL